MLNTDRAIVERTHRYHCEYCQKEELHDLYWDGGEFYCVCQVCGTVTKGDSE